MRLKVLAILASLLMVTSCGYSPNDDDGSWGAWSGIQDYMAPGVPSTVYFAYDSSALNDRARDVLDKQAEYLKENNKKVTVGGHTDERGTREYNLGLGDRRANAVKRYLVSKGVASGDVNTISYGKEKPKVIWSDTAENKPDVWSQNRRAETQ